MLDIFCCGQIKVFVWKILAQTNIRGPRILPRLKREIRAVALTGFDPSRCTLQ